MTKFKSTKPREIEKILLFSGFIVKRQSGSHRVYFNKITGKIVIVPFHNKDIPMGTLRSIIRQSGLEERLFTGKWTLLKSLKDLR